jgi:excisionase family DNA binding protein
MESEILNKEELAELLKVNIRTIDRLRKEGMPSFKVASNIRFDKKSVLEWLKAREEN